MSSSKPVTFVLVPGSFVTPEEYDKVDSLLKAKGHATKLVPLLTANDGTHLPPATMADDAAGIRSAILEILDTEQRNVVLALHSYAGIPGSSALDGLGPSARHKSGKSTAVLGVLYIGSFLPEVGESLRDIFTADGLVPGAGAFLQEPFKSGLPGEYLPAVPAEMAPYIFNDITDQEEVAKYFGLMVRHASDSYGAKATYAAWKYNESGVESIVMIPENDVILPVPLQEAMYTRAVEGDKSGKVRRVFVPGAGHCVNISMPEVVVKELEVLAVTG